jgi:hypothetical protein
MFIPSISPSCLYKYVGLQIALDGNMKAQIKDLQTKCVKLALVFTQSYFNANDAAQGFMTIYGPIVKYLLPVTSLNENQMTTIQQPVIKSVLSRLGFKLHMTRVVVHASTQFGGVGLLDLYTEQGCSKTLLVLAHLGYQHYLSKPLITLIESYIVLSGLMVSPLLNTHPVSYVSSPWMTTLCSFLHKHSIKIIIPSLQILNTMRRFDQPIMNQKIISSISKSDVEMINLCCLYLQVNTLSEITNHMGTMILPCACTGDSSETGLPKLHLYSKSKLVWPYQACPPRKAWRLWRTYLPNFTNATWHLQQPLGPWFDNIHLHRKWFYIHHDNQILHIQEDGAYIYESVVSRTRNRQKFIKGPMLQVQMLPIHLPMTPHLISPQFIYSQKAYTVTGISDDIDQNLDNYTKFACDLELPVDNQLHVYKQIDTIQAQGIGILISNNKIANIVTQKNDKYQYRTNSTIEFLSIRPTLHQCVTLFHQFIKWITIHVHCLTSTSYMKLKNHITSPFSSKCFMQAD